MSRPPHPNTMIGRVVVRVLDDGCDTCMFSKVYCRCVTYIDGQPCCDDCTH